MAVNIMAIELGVSLKWWQLFSPICVTCSALGDFSEGQLVGGNPCC